MTIVKTAVVVFILAFALCGVTDTSTDKRSEDLVNQLLEVLQTRENEEHTENVEVRSSAACSGQTVALRARSGRISTPGYGRYRYPNNARCRWCIIKDDPKAKIQLKFNTPFSIEEGPRCTYDSITIYEKDAGQTAQRIGRYCNSHPPPRVLVRTKQMVCLEFVSDFSTTGQGFTLDYTIIPAPTSGQPSACTGNRLEKLTGDNGEVKSLNYPNPYTNDLNCNWLIQVSKDKKIRLEIEDFDLEDDVHCGYDSLSIYDGAAANKDLLIGTYCGTKIPADIISTGNSVLLSFKSDESEVKGGFKIKYSSFQESTTERSTSGSTSSVTTSAPEPGKPATTTTPGPQIDLSCTFEEGGMCMWQQAAGGAINWRLKQAKHNTFVISNGERWGNTDHTTGTDTGHYIVIDGGEPIQQAGAKGYLVSPQLSAGPADGRCLTLWYNMFYTKGTLQVIMRRDGENDEVIWQRDGFQGNGWHKGRISLVSAAPYSIVLVGSRGTTDKETGIAVDDISFDNTPCLAIELDCGQSHHSVSRRSFLDDVIEKYIKKNIHDEDEDIAKRILGGQESKLGLWPWIVNIRTIPQGLGTFMACGGSLISRQWILTAAHCFEHNGQWLTDPVIIQLRLGEANVHHQGWESSQINLQPAKVIIHPQRSRDSMGQVAPYDIALIKLPHEISLTNEINVVCLPPAGSAFRPGSQCVVSGWGKTKAGEGSDQLLHVNLDLLSTSTCRSYFGNDIGSDVICAKHAREVKAACKGDSGGPLVCKNGDHYILAGVVSWGVPCSLHEQPLPNVFAKVTYYLPWIESTINSEQ